MWILLTAIMTLLWEKFNLSEVKIQVSENVVHVSDCTDQFFFLLSKIGEMQGENTFLPNVKHETSKTTFWGCLLKPFHS